MFMDYCEVPLEERRANVVARLAEETGRDYSKEVYTIGKDEWPIELCIPGGESTWLTVDPSTTTGELITDVAQCTGTTTDIVRLLDRDGDRLLGTAGGMALARAEGVKRHRLETVGGVALARTGRVGPFDAISVFHEQRGGGLGAELEGGSSSRVDPGSPSLRSPAEHEKETLQRAVLDMRNNGSVKADNPQFMTLLARLPCAKYMYVVGQGSGTSICIYTEAHGYTDARDDVLNFWDRNVKMELRQYFASKQHAKLLKAIDSLGDNAVHKLFSSSSLFRQLAEERPGSVITDMGQRPLLNCNDGVIYLDPATKLLKWRKRTPDDHVLWSRHVDVDLETWLDSGNGRGVLSSSDVELYIEMRKHVKQALPVNDVRQWLLALIAWGGLGQKSYGFRGALFVSGAPGLLKSTTLKMLLSGTGEIGKVTPSNLYKNASKRERNKEAMDTDKSGAAFELADELLPGRQADFDYAQFLEKTSGNRMPVADGKTVRQPMPIYTFNSKFAPFSPATADGAVTDKCLVINDSMLGEQIPPGSQDGSFLARAEGGAFRGAALHMLFREHNALVQKKGGVAFHPFAPIYLPCAAPSYRIMALLLMCDSDHLQMAHPLLPLPPVRSQARCKEGDGRLEPWIQAR